MVSVSRESLEWYGALGIRVGRHPVNECGFRVGVVKSLVVFSCKGKMGRAFAHQALFGGSTRGFIEGFTVGKGIVVV